MLSTDTTSLPVSQHLMQVRGADRLLITLLRNERALGAQSLPRAAALLVHVPTVLCRPGRQACAAICTSTVVVKALKCASGKSRVILRLCTVERMISSMSLERFQYTASSECSCVEARVNTCLHSAMPVR